MPIFQFNVFQFNVHYNFIVFALVVAQQHHQMLIFSKFQA